MWSGARDLLGYSSNEIPFWSMELTEVNQNNIIYAPNYAHCVS